MGESGREDHGLTHGWGAGDEEHAGRALHGSGRLGHASCMLGAPGLGHAGRVSCEPGCASCLDSHVGRAPGLLHKLGK